MVVFKCPSCSEKLFDPSLSDVRLHLNSHKLFGQLQHPIACGIANCRSSLQTVSTYVKHFESIHLKRTKKLLDPIFEPNPPVTTPSPPSFNYEFTNCATSLVSEPEAENPPFVQTLPSFSESMICLQDCLKIEITNILIDLRSAGNIPLKVSVDVMKYLSNCVDLIVEKTSAALEVELNSYENDGLNKEVIVNMLQSFNSIKSVVPSMGGSEHRIRKTCDLNPRFVLPEPLPLGSRSETVLTTVNGQSKVRIVTRSNNAQYVSIERTLRAEMLDPITRNIILKKPVIKDGLYESFHSGSRCSKQPCEFCDPSKNVVVIQIFFDGLGITNFARDAAKLHNSGMFYFSVLNLPPRFNAALSNIHLIAMCNTLDMKNGGLDIIAEKIVTECNRLSTVGMVIDTDDGPITVFAKVAQFTGDNLGLNQIFGFIESFSADYCCLLCYATREDMRTFQKESDFQLRTRTEYEADVSQLSNLPPGKNHCRGVKAASIFNDLIDFHICDNWVNDAMHTVIEGVDPHVTGNVLYSISKLDSNVTFDSFNREMSVVFNGLIVDRHNKPFMLNTFSDLDKGMSPKQSSAQQTVLSRYVPLILFKLVKNKECYIYIKLLLMLQKIKDLIFAPQLNEELLHVLADLIDEFISLFKNLYPDSPIRPKLHFLVHYPSIIRKNGPARTFWCMNYERMNGAVKVPSHVMKNFKDPQKTLAYRRQCAALRSRLERSNNRNFVSISKSYVEAICDIGLEWADNYSYYAKDFESDSVIVSNKVILNGTQYRNGMLVILADVTDSFIFGEIEFIVCEDAGKPLLFVTIFDTIEFHELSFCYKICQRIPSQARLCEIENLLDPLPLDLITINEENFVRLKYNVMRNNVSLSFK